MREKIEKERVGVLCEAVHWALDTDICVLACRIPILELHTPSDCDLETPEANRKSRRQRMMEEQERLERGETIEDRAFSTASRRILIERRLEQEPEDDDEYDEDDEDEEVEEAEDEEVEAAEEPVAEAEKAAKPNLPTAEEARGMLGPPVLRTR